MVVESKLTSERVVVVSILNWNTAEMTLGCVRQLKLLALPRDVRLEIVIIDNASKGSDAALLSEHSRDLGYTLLVQPRNLGFAGGTNVAVRFAQERKADFIWLINSDAVVDQASTLADLLDLMDVHPECGAASPKLLLASAPFKPYFVGAFHDWQARQSVRVDEAETVVCENRRPKDMWVPGTALFLRITALNEAGPLDERFFAYYEDDEICARLAARGWTSRMCFSAAVKHSMPKAETDRPPYYFYLILRNYLLFWYENTPPESRNLLFLKLMDQAFFQINKLSWKGYPQHAEAAALGLHDFLKHTFGAPNLQRPVPVYLRIVIRLMQVIQRNALIRTFGPRNYSGQTVPQ